MNKSQTHRNPSLVLLFSLVLAASMFAKPAMSQAQVELFLGEPRVSLDLMFFDYLNKKGQPSHWLFFNRNRVVQTVNGLDLNYPSFGFTEALSYQHKSFKGFAPVGVAQFLATGFYVKAGLQWVYVRERVTLFTWLVSTLGRKPAIDHFILLGYRSKERDRLGLYSQLELISSFGNGSFCTPGLTVRIRLGLQKNTWQFGLGADLRQAFFDTSMNSLERSLGLFLRHEF
ncbi:MAG: hypothetical protein HYZ16_05920 [Bacteroidetes bacterium]|nr:hypothetical protein [Bacteroidota bacterium]